MSTVMIVFAVFALWVVVSALLCITRTNAIASAMWLVSTMFALAAIFVLLEAEFIAAIQVLVYAGAVMVLFLFVIMLLNVETAPREWKRWPRWLLAGGLVAVLAAELVALHNYTPARLAREFSTMPDSMAIPAYVFPATIPAGADPRGVVGRVAEPLFQVYLVPFEITSILLLAALIGAVVLAKKRL